MYRVRAAWILACAAQLALPLLHAEPGPTFLPDATFKGSTLAGWHTFGSAFWSANNGEITAKGGEGWLVLDKPYQDSALYTSFRCTGPCNAGILMRMEKRDAGSTGIMLGIEGDALVPYRVMIDANGKITDKTKLRNAAGQHVMRRRLLRRERPAHRERDVRRPRLRELRGFLTHLRE